MNYGYFDEKAREYVITNPNTPAPWANYLGSPISICETKKPVISGPPAGNR